MVNNNRRSILSFILQSYNYLSDFLRNNFNCIYRQGLLSFDDVKIVKLADIDKFYRVFHFFYYLARLKLSEIPYDELVVG